MPRLPRSPFAALAAVALALALALAVAAPLRAQAARDTSTPCAGCTAWNRPHPPFRLFGNTWYVGTAGLTALLITSPAGHVLVDAGLPASAPRIAESIRALGFRVEDVKLIVNSHAHFDHAGGIAALQRQSGAEVAAHPWSARMLESGRAIAGDPQLGVDIPYPAVRSVRRLRDREMLRVGPSALTAHWTGGHTPGSTSWSWRACEGSTCLDFVYADSQTPVSADDFLFTRNADYRDAIADFARGHARLDSLACDVLVTPHPGASRLFERVAAGMLREGDGCRRYAERARAAVAERVQKESQLTPRRR